MKIRQIFNLLFLLIYSSCDRATVVDTNKATDTRKEDSLHIQYQAHKDSIVNIYTHINIPRSWENVDRSYDQIYIDISTEPQIDLVYDMGDSSAIYHVIDIKHCTDSLVFVATNYSGDIKYNWSFKSINLGKGKWSIFNPQTKYYKTVGTYKSKPEN